MRHRLPILSAVAAVACVGVVAGVVRWSNGRVPEPPAAQASTTVDIRQSEAAALVADAARRMAEFDSVDAKARHRVQLFGREWIGTGRYLQGPPGSLRMRLELKIQTGDQASSLLHVADGRTLWTRTDIDGSPTLARVDLTKVAASDGSAGMLETTAELPLGPGGLPVALDSLASSFQFRQVREAKIGRLAGYEVLGAWKPERLALFLPEQAEAIQAGQPADLERLPPYLPTHVVLFLGQDDLIPYRIDYRRKTDGAATLSGDDEGDRSIVRMELFEVRIGAAIDAQQFAYQPGDMAVADRTEEFSRRLGR